MPMFPKAKKQLAELGFRLRLARERRGISQALASERIGVARDTLRRLEAGDPSARICTILRALRILGLDRDIEHLAANTELKQKLDDIEALGIAVKPARARPIKKQTTKPTTLTAIRLVRHRLQTRVGGSDITARTPVAIKSAMVTSP